MRRLIVLSTLMMVGCADSAPPTSAVSSKNANPSFSSSDGKERLALNTRLVAENEIPTSTSISVGSAKLHIPATGPIRSIVEIDNLGREVIRFCHIHWTDPATGTGPVVWFLTPTGANVGTSPGLQLVTETFVIGQDADYVNNSRFGADTPANEATARDALLNNPSEFYVNCHSNTFPGGFVRGNLHNGNH